MPVRMEGGCECVCVLCTSVFVLEHLLPSVITHSHHKSTREDERIRNESERENAKRSEEKCAELNLDYRSATEYLELDFAYQAAHLIDVTFILVSFHFNRHRRSD